MTNFEKEMLIAFEDVEKTENYLYQNLSENLIKKIKETEEICNCYFDILSPTSRATVSDEIWLFDISNFPHEATHILLGASGMTEKAWLNEGLAEYFGCIMNGSSMTRYFGESIREYYEDLKKRQGESAELEKAHVAKYMEWGGRLERSPAIMGYGENLQFIL